MRPQERALATLKRGRGESRVRAAPAVSCAPCIKQKTHMSIQVQRKHSGLPCAMALRLIRALPGDLDLLVTIASGHYRQLDANPGASGPHAFAVRDLVFRPRASST